MVDLGKGADGEPLDDKRVSNLVDKPMREAMRSKRTTSAWRQDGAQDAPHMVCKFSEPNCP